MTARRLPTDASTQDALLAELYDVGRLFRREFHKRERAHDMTRAQWHVLGALVHNAGCRQIQLADMLDIEPITLVRLLDRLEAAGLVERRPDPTDRRARLIFLTDAAAPVIAQIDEVGNTCAEVGLHGFSAAERATLLGLLQRIRRNFDQRGYDAG